MSHKFENDTWFTAKELAGLADMPQTAQGVNLWGRKTVRNERKNTCNLGLTGGGVMYPYTCLPIDTQRALILNGQYSEKPELSDYVKTLVAETEKEIGEPIEYRVDWDHFDRKPGKQKAEAYRKAEILREFKQLLDNEHGNRKQVQLMKLVADNHNMSWRTLQNWYLGNKGKIGVKHFDIKDWPAALINGFVGRQRNSDWSQAAFDYYGQLYLSRRQPTYQDCYMRTAEVAAQEDWLIGCARTMQRYVEDTYSAFTKILYREGEVATRKTFPFQHRDKTCFKAGEAVTGDGVKFDKVWVEFPDGERINTCTAWVWQDIYSGKITAHRLAKTENTDVFRLATYDLLGVATPCYMQIDNTRAAANKAMTGHIQGRHRFKDLPTDAPGILFHLGIDAHFTNPDHTISNPGVKPIERAFGIGGLHDKVAHNPALRGRGFSKKTAVPFTEFQQIVAAEIQRHNSQGKRRSDVCQGVYSFNEVFEKSFAVAAPRKTTEQQRSLLLMMPEKVRCAANNGMITLKAGKGPAGRNRYYTDKLTAFAGEDLVAFYDPDNLHSKVSLYSMDCRYLFDADWESSTAFNDTTAAREHSKNIQRKRKAAKLVAKAESRLSELEVQQYSQTTPQPPETTPAPTIITGNFKRTIALPKAVEIDVDTGGIINAETLFGKAAEQMEKALQHQLSQEI